MGPFKQTRTSTSKVKTGCVTCSEYSVSIAIGRADRRSKRHDVSNVMKRNQLVVDVEPASYIVQDMLLKTKKLLRLVDIMLLFMFPPSESR
jgi:hypothetical protein